jgi:hypothetical protein
MIKLSNEDLLRHTASDTLQVDLACMICMAFPRVSIEVSDLRIWRQLDNPVPSNRLCFHIRHQLDCPHCELGIESQAEQRARFFMESSYREEVLRRDGHTCQACGYKQKEKPASIRRRKKTETRADYLYRRFISGLCRSEQPRSLAVAHYSRRYEEESYENRHRLENARTLCVDCHNAETAKHQMEEWLERMKECPWLRNLE